MSTLDLIKNSVDEVKTVFDKFDIDTSCLDITDKNESMFNAVFIKSFLSCLNEGDFEFFKKLRDEFLFPVPSISIGSLTSEDEDDFEG